MWPWAGQLICFFNSLSCQNRYKDRGLQTNGLQRCPHPNPGKESESESRSVVYNSLWPHGLYSPRDSAGHSTGVGSLSLLQGIFPTQRSNPGLSHSRWILYLLSHEGSPRILQWVAYPFSSRSSQLRNWTPVSHIADGFFTNWATVNVLGYMAGVKAPNQPRGPRNQMILGSWKTREVSSALEPSERSSSDPPVRLQLGFWPPELESSKFVLVYPPNVWSSITAARGGWYGWCPAPGAVAGLEEQQGPCPQGALPLWPRQVPRPTPHHHLVLLSHWEVPTGDRRQGREAGRSSSALSASPP